MMTLSSTLVDVMCRSATSDVEQCHARIDKDLVALAESMRILRPLRDCVAHISCFPLEILSTVFRHYVEEQNFASHTSNSAPTRLTVKRLQAVTPSCSRMPDSL
ncbi:hypothetical protein DFH29DRAFT_1075006, partial [Suillus ampliporus]